MATTNLIDRSVGSIQEGAAFTGVTSGRIIDVSDPEERGRVKIFCPALGDIIEEEEHIPWAAYAAPFAGITTNPTIGPNQDTTGGILSYGTWAIPDVGSTAIVMLIDGLPNRRIWLGCLPSDYFTHTLPHGRFMSDTKTPLSSTEQPIQPMAQNLKSAFNNDIDSYEYGTRALDRQASTIRNEHVGRQADYSSMPDEKEFEIERTDGNNTSQTQGYLNGKSSIFSQTTPGMHSMSMDDDPSNCRVRFRTACGHQIIMDDTNERIYIGTSQGNTWIEIDEKGTIDIYSSEDTSIRADGDLNLSAGKRIRMAASEGIHLASGEDIRMHSSENIHIKSDGELKIKSTGASIAELAGDFSFKVGGKYSITSNSLAINTSNNINMQAANLVIKTSGYDFDGSGIKVRTELGAGTNIIANGQVYATDVNSPLRSLNSHEHLYTAPKTPEIPPLTIQQTIPSFQSGGIQVPSIVASPDDADDSPAEEKPAYFNSRVPTHEPFPRSYIDINQSDKDNTGETNLGLFDIVNVNDISTILEYEYDDSNVGRRSNQRGLEFNRNKKWRR